MIKEESILRNIFTVDGGHLKLEDQSKREEISHVTKNKNEDVFQWYQNIYEMHLHCWIIYIYWHIKYQLHFQTSKNTNVENKIHGW